MKNKMQTRENNESIWHVLCCKPNTKKSRLLADQSKFCTFHDLREFFTIIIAQLLKHFTLNFLVIFRSQTSVTILWNDISL